MKTLDVLFGVRFPWVWLFPLALGLLIVSGRGLLMGLAWVSRCIGAFFNAIQKRNTKKWGEKNLGYCFRAGCEEMATEDLYMNIIFDDGVVLKEIWRVCKGCAKNFNGASIKTQWLSWMHFLCDNPEDTGRYQAKPEDGTDPKTLKTIWPRGVQREPG
jgi:hypothetical protein